MSRFLDQRKFSKFCASERIRAKFGISESDTSTGVHTVGTWHVDDLVVAYKESLPGGEADQDRKRLIESQRRRGERFLIKE
ncbi:hypothetical protein A3709_18970 [Halioglobus sp. HI00S01]|uniref:hypothetical protein n=1 Tax=Halioglobus sp. HI00S01 TaxID=1822214 RepID=UPI0007C2B397|nr:hypothetical protein [Halioglobus sp. HI00S01]KZX57707.1 hypothetical protein A3709_18970 [Halioglobus sp. HI00S01]